MLILMLLLSCTTLIAQPQFKFDKYTLKDGIPELEIRAIAQDSLGFLWIGTANGLYRYDGHVFKLYTSDPMDSTSLSSVDVEEVFIDSANRLWIGTRGGGLNLYNSEEDAFVHFRYSEGDSTTVPHDWVWVMEEDNQGRIWVGCGFGLAWLDPDKQIFHPLLPNGIIEEATSEDLYFKMDKAPNGDIWIGTIYDVIRYNASTDEFISYTHLLGESEKQEVSDFYIHNSNEVYVCTSKDIICFNVNEEKIHDDPAFKFPKEITKTFIQEIYPDNGIFWLAGYYGDIFYYDPKDNSFVHVKYDPLIKNSYNSGGVIDVFHDREENLWIGGFTGLSRLNKRKSQFRLYRHDPDDPHSLSDDVVATILEKQDGMILLGTPKGLDQFNRKTEKFSLIESSLTGEQGIFGEGAWALIEDYQGSLWIGTFWGGVNHYNPKTGQYRFYQHDPNDENTLPDPHIWRLFEDSQHNIWAGSQASGLSRYDPANDRFIRYLHDPTDSTSISQTWITSITEDHQGMIWVSVMAYGVNKFDPETRKFVRYKNNQQDDSSLGHNNVYSLFCDSKGNIWIATKGSGVDKYIPESQTFKHYRVADGLPSDMVYNIIEDDNENLWFSTDGGFAIFDPKTERFFNIGLHDGLIRSRWNTSALVKSRHTGEFIYGGDNGFIIFHPDSITKNEVISPIMITELLYHDKESNTGRSMSLPLASFKDQIELTYRNNIIEISFSSMSFQDPSRNQYYYQLEGFSPQWIDLGNTNKVTFTNLDPGDYVFHIKGSNNDGVLHEEATSLAITIAPPWWLTWWAKLIYGILIAAILYALYLWRTRQQRKELSLERKKLEQEQKLTEELKRVDQLKDQFLANTSHELRTPLQGIIGLSESLLEEEEKPNKKEDLSMIISSGKRLGTLVNDILDFSKLRHQELKLQLRPVDIKAAVDVVFTLSKPMIKRKPIELENAIPKDIPFARADENRIQQILHNLIGNAIKFTDKGKITATGKQENNHLVISIRDEGIGIPGDKLDAIFDSFEQLEDSLTREYGGTGLGLTVTKRLIELHGGQVSVISEPGIGSIFTFTLPMSEVDRGDGDPAIPASGLSAIISSATEEINDFEILKEETEIIGLNRDKVRILIVDDEPVNRKVLENHLIRVGYEVVQAVDGPQALEIIKKDQKFDLVLLDIMMPKMSGYEVCHRIRDVYLPSELPVVMLTAKNRVTDLVEGFHVGANDYLTKPFSKDELLTRIKTHLNLHQIHRASGKFVPSEFLRAVGRESITEVQLGDHIEKEVTIFFSDIRHYTTLSEAMTPEDNFQFINDYVGRMGPIIRSHKGFISQYLGDGIMAIFPKELDYALAACVEMQHNVSAFNKTQEKLSAPQIAVGMGLHEGPLIMGIIGDADRNDPTTIADSVNIASRMEGLTKYYGANIIVSEDCLNTITNQDLFHFRYLGKVQVKGKQQAVGIYECFDGDEKKIRALKNETLDIFQKGLDCFYAQDFAQASAYFDEILKANKKDRVAHYFRNRSARHMLEGVSDDWTGVEKLESK